MVLRQTERVATRKECIDRLPSGDAVARMLALQMAAVRAVETAVPQIEGAAACVAETIRKGGRLNYVAAGSSALMALADGSELPGTFGIAQDQIRVFMAGGVPVDAVMPGETEDDTSETDAIIAGLGKSDLVFALSASGSTPYPCAIAQQARGVKVISIANTDDSPLLRLADVAIYLPTPSEALAGSTRLGAGTAQKIALNIISTLAGVQLGHVYNGMMVNLRADNTKLRARAARIVSQITGVTPEKAERCLSAAQHETKLAVLLATGCDADIAKDLLGQNMGHLGPCLATIAAMKPE